MMRKKWCIIKTGLSLSFWEPIFSKLHASNNFDFFAEHITTPTIKRFNFKCKTCTCFEPGKIPKNPGKGSIKCRFQLGYGWGRAGRGHSQSEKAFYRDPAGELSLWSREGFLQEKPWSANEISLSVEMIRAKQERGEAQQGNTTWNYNGSNGGKKERVGGHRMVLQGLDKYDHKDRFVLRYSCSSQVSHYISIGQRVCLSCDGQE